MPEFFDSIASVGERDNFSVFLTAGVTYYIEQEGSATSQGSLADPFVRVYSSFLGLPFVELASNDDGGVGFNSRLLFTPTSSGTYVVQAGELGDNATGSYRLRVNADDLRDSVEGVGTLGAVTAGAVGSSGNISFSGDADVFSVSLTAGQQYFLDMEGLPTGRGSISDPFLRLLNGSDVVLTSNDDGGVGFNSRVVFTPTSSGTYYLSAQGLGSSTGTYQLFAHPDDFKADSPLEFSTGNFGTLATDNSGAAGSIDYAGDRDRFAVTLTAGQQYFIEQEGSATAQGTLVDTVVRLFDGSNVQVGSDDDGGVGNSSRLVFTATTSGTYYVEASDFSDNDTGTYRVFARPDDFKADSPLESTTGNFGTLAADNVGAAGSIDYAGDHDRFAVTLTAGQQYFIEQEGSPTGQGTLADTVVRLFDSSNFLVGTNDDGGVGSNSRLVFTAATSGTYYVEASDFGENSTGTYRVFAHADDFKAEAPFEATTGAYGVVATGGSATGNINYIGDTDVFSTTLVSGLTYTAEVRGSATGNGTLVDPNLRVYDPTFAQIATDDDSGVGFNSLATFTANAGTGTYYIGAEALGNNATGTYRVVLSAGNATAGNDSVTGSGVGDAINGLAGNDTIGGGGGNDLISGGQGKDSLTGGDGNDTVNGGAGQDILIGGANNDRFVFNNTTESTGATADIIRAGGGVIAFEGAGAALGDLIDVSGIDANTTIAGNQAFIFGGTGLGHLQVINNGANSLVLGNTDADAAFEFRVVIEDGGVLANAYTAADFVL